MDFPKKQLLVVGDRVLITPEDGDDRTRVGLYLPATAIDAQQVQTGLIVATGPGDPVADLSSSLDDEPWKAGQGDGRGRAMQARVGDHAIFFRKAAVEITFEEKALPRRAAGCDPGPGPGRPADLTAWRREPPRVVEGRTSRADVLFPHDGESPLTLSEVRAMLPAGIGAHTVGAAEAGSVRRVLPAAQTVATLVVGSLLVRPGSPARRRSEGR